jgi:transcriptional regulator with XRE-family HTH domain
MNNWSKLIREIMDSGMTQKVIAERCNTGQSYISGLLNKKKKSPNWQLGQNLIELHKSQKNN